MEKEKWERLNQQLEAAKIQMAMSLAPLGKQMEQLKKALEPISEQLFRAAEAYEAALARVEIEYQEAAAFYRDWIGKTPPRFKRFLDWYYETKDIEAQIELLSNPSAMREGDIEAAALWMVAEIKEARKALQITKPEAGLGEEEAKSPATGFEWIRETIAEAAKRFPEVPTAQIEKEASELIELANDYLFQLELGTNTAQKIADELGKVAKAAQRACLESSSKNIFPENIKMGLFSLRFTPVCQALVLPKLAAVFLGMEQEEEGKRERLELAQRLAKKVLSQYPQTADFADEKSVRWVYFPVLEVAFQKFNQLRKDAHSEEAFREKLRGELAGLEAEKERLYNPEDIKNYPYLELELLPARKAYLNTLFKNTLLAKYLTALFFEEGQPEAGEGPPQELTFEGLFILPSVPALVIRAMQEAEPEPLLNSDVKAILFGKANVAPVIALADILFARKLVKGGIAKKAAYKAICNRFGFELSTRPDKARKEGAGTYQDYKDHFYQFFLSNRPE